MWQSYDGITVQDVKSNTLTLFRPNNINNSINQEALASMDFVAIMMVPQYKM